MKKIFIFLFAVISTAAYTQGFVENKTIHSTSLENKGGENPDRNLAIYLPPEYQNTTKKYPVIYFLPGFSSKSEEVVSQLQPILDNAISLHDIKPIIVVIPDHYTLYRQSYYSNSLLTGNWIDYTKNEVVEYIDQHYRTLATKESRALAGWSSGGFGALKVGMQSTEVFANIYSLSPGLLMLSDEFAPNSPAYKRLTEIKTREQLIEGWNEGIPNILAAAGRAFAPNPENPPFYADMPVNFNGNNAVIDEEILQKWNSQLPYNMLDRYASDLRNLHSFKLEWGRNDDFKNVITSCRAFSKKLENLGIAHIAEEYNGTHFNRIFTADGRIAKEMLPFLDSQLAFE